MQKKISGRSMVEMLGVLALVGVLTIGALFGYRLVMDSHKANELLEDVGLYAAAVMHSGLNIETGEFTPTTPYGFEASFADEEAGSFYITALNIPRGVCRFALNKAQGTYTVRVNDEVGGNCVEGVEGNRMDFLFNSDCECFGICFMGGCYDSSCKTIEKHFDCRIAESIHDEENCKYTEKEICSNTQYCNDNGRCTNCDAVGAIVNDKGHCVCPSGQYLNKAENKCEDVNCDNDGSCYFGGLRCGKGCNNDGSGCTTGMCQNICPKGTLYTYHEGKNLYGCRRGDLLCSRDGGYNSCWLKNGDRPCGICSDYIGEKCGYGSCSSKQCPEASSWEKPTGMIGNWNFLNYGCRLSENLYCANINGYKLFWKKNETWVQCATDCDSNCENCEHDNCGDKSSCKPGWTEIEYAGKKASACINASAEENASVLCHVSNPDFRCLKRNKEGNWEFCGSMCDSEGNCSRGSCKDECPAGYTYEFLGDSGYGCKNENIVCHRVDGLFLCSSGGFPCYTGNSSNCGKYNSETKKWEITAGCSCSTSSCPDGSDEIKDQETGIIYCVNRSTTSKCTTSGGTCYIKDGADNGYRRCGERCNPDGSNCSSGLCVDNCGNGLVFGYVMNNYYGCISTTTPRVSCYKDGNKYNCYVDSSPCGEKCTDYKGTGCADCEVEEIKCEKGETYDPGLRKCAVVDYKLNCTTDSSGECVHCVNGYESVKDAENKDKCECKKTYVYTDADEHEHCLDKCPENMREGETCLLVVH